MSRERTLRASDRWFRLLTRLYPTDFCDEMGSAMADTYRDRARRALDSGSTMAWPPSGGALSPTRCAMVSASGCGRPSPGDAGATGAATWSWPRDG
jgi:hypothetical protein